MCKVKKCKRCHSNKALHFFLLKNGSGHASRCQRCRDIKEGYNKKKRHCDASKRYEDMFGLNWKVLAIKDDMQACKKCKSIKPVLEFKKKTKSMVSTCWDCCAAKKPLRLQRIKESVYEKGKGQICNHCKQDRPIDEFGYNKHHCKHVKVCKKCVAQKAKDKRFEKREGDCSHIDYVDCNICGCVGLLTDRRKYYIKGACYKCGINNKPRKPKTVTCQNCGCDVVSSSGQSKYCPPCRKEWQSSHMTRITEERAPIKRYDEKAYFLSKIGESSPLEYICCIACGDKESKRSNRVYHVKDCCYSCGHKIKSNLMYYDKRLESFTPHKECDQCSSKFTVGLLDSGRRKCRKCVRKNASKSRREAAQRRRYKRRTEREDGIRYDPYDIFKRDKWRCKMCGIKVHKRSTLLPDSAEVDHIVPLSIGGRDIPSNVQCSCRQCNGDKGASIAGQISLFALTRERAGAG